MECCNALFYPELVASEGQEKRGAGRGDLSNSLPATQSCGCGGECVASYSVFYFLPPVPGPVDFALETGDDSPAGILSALRCPHPSPRVESASVEATVAELGAKSDARRAFDPAGARPVVCILYHSDDDVVTTSALSPLPLVSSAPVEEKGEASGVLDEGPDAAGEHARLPCAALHLDPLCKIEPLRCPLTLTPSS